MIPLPASLDDIDFDALLALGRDRLPALAPSWTDFNYHDPGITLIELIAWVADTQIYALGRNRLDERLAMASLIGLRPRGAVPATGVLYLTETAAQPGPLDYDIPRETRLTPASGQMPRLEVAHAVSLLPVALVRLVAEGSGGTIDFTDSNRHARTSFSPFGVPPAPGAALVATLAGKLPERELRLSLGIEIEGGGNLIAGDDRLGAVSLFYRRKTGEEILLERLVDTSVDLQRSGAIVVRLPANGPQLGNTSHDIVLRTDSANALMPRLLRIAPNALPVVQKARFEREHFGTGRANQKVVLEPASLFDVDEAVPGRAWRMAEGCLHGVDPPFIRVGGSPGRAWKAGDLDRAGPGDEIYAASESGDGGRIEIAFGNGVNGRRPGRSEVIEISIELSCGDGGNVATSAEWLMPAPRLRWRNPQPISGGSNAQNVADLLDSTREQLREQRALTTSGEIEKAALQLPEAYGISRAAVLDGWEPGRRRPASAATRTLLVTRRGEASESQAWLRAIARNLRPRLPLGERLIVAAPRYRDLRISASITAAAGQRTDIVAQAVRDDLAARLIPGGARPWPLGRDLSVDAVAGWIRRLPGVAAVSAVSLREPDGAPLGEILMLRPDQLPRLVTIGGEEDIRVEAGGRR